MNKLQHIFYLLVFLTLSLPAFSQKYNVYISSYSGDHDKGISQYKFSENTGKFHFVTKPDSVQNSSYLCLHPSGRYLYSVASGEITAFSIDGRSGELILLNKQDTDKGPCYVAIDHTGNWILVSNYSGGSIQVFPVDKQGALGASQQLIRHEGSSINKNRQEGPHPHMIMTSPDNKYVIVPDLGADKIFVYKLNSKSGTLKPNDPNGVQATPGAGPRHFAFHPNNKFGYVLNELNSTVTAYSWDEQSGILTTLETENLLPEDFTDYNKSADIHLTPDGQFLYATNRGHNSITAFQVMDDGYLKLISHFPTKGETPRNFVISPRGKYLMVANKGTGNIIMYKIDPKTGRLIFENEILNLIAPQCIKMLPIE